MTSSSNSPCAACKFLRRKCTHECVFAPYFPPDQPQKFVNVHKVFGASNVTKLLNELAANQREDAVNSLAYEAEARLRDPIYGCVGLISLLQNKLRQVQLDLYNAKKELSVYVGPSAMMSIPHPAMMPSHPYQGGASSSMVPYGMSSMGAGLPPSGPSQAHLMMREQQHIMDSQQLAAAVREQELMRNYEHQQELARFNSGFDGGSGSAVLGFNQMSGRAGSPSPLALVPFDNSFQVQQEPEHQHPYQQRQRAGSDEGRSIVGPSS